MPPWLLRFFCALALVMTAYAHKPPALTAAAPADLALYVLPDGSVPTLCISGHGEEQDDDHRHDGVACEFCRIAGSVAMPAPPADAAALEIAFAEARFAALTSALRAAAAFEPAAPPQGPPFLSV